eukprot:gene7343-464_t
MENCLIERCGDMTVHSILLVACGSTKLDKCSFINNKSDAVVVQCDNRQSAPELGMRECILKGNMSGVIFGFGIVEGSGGGSGILFKNQITDNASFGLSISAVAPNQQIHLMGNVFRGNGLNGEEEREVVLQNVQDQRSSGTRSAGRAIRSKSNPGVGGSWPGLDPSSYPSLSEEIRQFARSSLRALFTRPPPLRPLKWPLWTGSESAAQCRSGVVPFRWRATRKQPTDSNTKSQHNNPKQRTLIHPPLSSTFAHK